MKNLPFDILALMENTTQHQGLLVSKLLTVR